MEEIKAILNCKMTYFSIARFSGGAVVNGKKYVYIPEQDALIRKDLMKSYNKQKKEGKRFEEIINNL